MANLLSAWAILVKDNLSETRMILLSIVSTNLILKAQKCKIYLFFWKQSTSFLKFLIFQWHQNSLDCVLQGITSCGQVEMLWGMKGAMEWGWFAISGLCRLLLACASSLPTWSFAFSHFYCLTVIVPMISSQFTPAFSHHRAISSLGSWCSLVGIVGNRRQIFSLHIIHSMFMKSYTLSLFFSKTKGVSQPKCLLFSIYT